MKEKIIEKIRKLMIHENSARAIGNTGEADNFAERIKHLRAKHNITGVIELDPADTYGAEPVFDRTSPLFKRKRIFWEELLFANVCLFFDCKPLFFSQTNLKIVLGEPENRTKVIKTYLHLFEMIRAEAPQYIDSWRELYEVDTKKWTRDLYLGFGYGIGQRLCEIRMREEFVKAKRASQSNENRAAQTGAPQLETTHVEAGLVVSDKPVHRPTSEKRKRIEKELSNIGQAKTSITEVEQLPYMMGAHIAKNCGLADEMALPEKTVLQDLEEIEREERQRTKSSIFERMHVFGITSQRNFNFE